MSTRSFNDWLHAPSFEESVCKNPFRDVVLKVIQNSPVSRFDPYAPDESHVYTKVARLINAELILLEGDVIYVREGHTLHPLNEAQGLLAYYMHTDSKEASAATAILESNFQGYFPITDNKVWRNGIVLEYEDGSTKSVDLSTLSETPSNEGYPEYGHSLVKQDHFTPLVEYFSLMNEHVDDDWFFEKTLMYPFNQRIREKSHVLVGDGGQGKSLFMLMIERLYGSRTKIDAPQPNFKGHDAGVISYNFIGKRIVTFNDVGDPSVDFLEWMKRMITGNLEVKTPSGAWLTVPCKANFLMETNHVPDILDINAHKRRFVVRSFPKSFQLAQHMSEADLDIIGERGDITAGDLVNYLMMIKSSVPDWITFDDRKIERTPGADF